MNNFLFYLAAFAPLLGALIIFHEYGHYPVSYTHLTLPTNREV